MTEPNEKPKAVLDGFDMEDLRKLAIQPKPFRKRFERTELYPLPISPKCMGLVQLFDRRCPDSADIALVVGIRQLADAFSAYCISEDKSPCADICIDCSKFRCCPDAVKLGEEKC